MICRPRREKRPPRKLADAAELCDASEDFGGERLFGQLHRDVFSLLCRVPFILVPTQDASAGQGAKRSAAQALQAEATPSAGQLQRSSQWGVHTAAAVSSQRATDIEISEGSYHHPGLCLLHAPLAVIRCRLIAFVELQAHPFTRSHASYIA